MQFLGEGVSVGRGVVMGEALSPKVSMCVPGGWGGERERGNGECACGHSKMNGSGKKKVHVWKGSGQVDGLRKNWPFTWEVVVHLTTVLQP